MEIGHAIKSAVTGMPKRISVDERATASDLELVIASCHIESGVSLPRNGLAFRCQPPWRAFVAVS
jgi:hypothetical protein